MNSQHVPLAADKEAQLGSTGYTAEQLLRVQVNKVGLVERDGMYEGRICLCSY